MDYNLTQENYSNSEVQGLLDKFIQSETDKVRTDLYTNKIKPLEADLLKYKPAEKSDTEKQLEIKLAELNKKERKLSFKEAGLPDELSELVNEAADIEKIKEIFKSNAIYTPNQHKKNADGITKEEFDKMSYSEKAKLYETNPELVKTLF